MGIYLILPTLLTIFASFLIVKAGAIALMLTGMDSEKANFQALSAFTRTGFTTREAELMVNNPRRRRIATWLIILGNAGLIAVIVTASSSIATSQGYKLLITIAALLVGTYLLYRLTKHRSFVRRWERFVENRIVKLKTLEESTTEELLHLVEGYGLTRVIITKESHFIGRSLVEANTPENEFWVVGIERGKDWISLPRSREVIDDGDRLVVYGNLNNLKSIFARD